MAVLPFADLSQAADQRYFCEGLADELIGALTQIDGLSVASRTSSLQLGGPGGDVRLIGARLHVATVLEGSVRRDGDRLRISAQLIDVADDRHRWAAVFERELYQVFAIQIEIAESIVRALRVVLTDRERRALHRVPRVEIGAYDWYLRGGHHSAQASGRNLEAGRQMFLRAIELDPDFVPALVGLADCCAWLPRSPRSSPRSTSGSAAPRTRRPPAGAASRKPSRPWTSTRAPSARSTWAPAPR